MKRLFSLVGTLALAAPLALGQTSTWVPDKAHSGVDFSVLHMGLSKVCGHFGNIGGTIVASKPMSPSPRQRNDRRQHRRYTLAERV